MKKPDLKTVLKFLGTTLKKAVKYLKETKMHKKVPFEVYKNFKLIFRNWVSLLLIILAPLFLILLVGYSFSGDTLHGIKIGAFAEENINLSDFAENITSFAEVQRYQNIKDCLVDMALARTHMCLEIEGSFALEKGEIPTSEVKFYYDNTKKKTSLLLLSEIKDYFGLTSEKISLISTQEIFDNLQELLIFIDDRIDDIDDIKEESKNIEADLLDRKNKLIEIRDDFTPKYKSVKSIQSKINSQMVSFNQTSKSLLDAIDNLKDATSALKSDPNWASGDSFALAVEQLERAVDDVADKTEATIKEINRIKSSLDSVVLELDAINSFLNEEIERTDNYISLIRASVEKIEATSKEAKEKMKDLSRLDPSLASKLAKPITQSFEALIKNVRDVQLAFPVLLTTVIIFISLIFSNMITLLEIHNKAYTRNILAPVDDIVYTIGIAITNFIIISFQVGVLLAVAQTSFSINVWQRLSSLIPIIVVLMFTFIFIGMIIAYITRNMQTSILLSTFVALAFFLFSDAINALEAMPKIASYIAILNPVVVVNSMFRMIFFFNIKLLYMPIHFGLLLFYMIAAGALLVYISKKKNRQRF